jgi:N-methylhydantoinase B
VFHHLFAAIAEEMGVALMRSAFSPNIKERRDFSCAIFDAEGRMIGQAAHLPIHLGATPMSVAAAIAETELADGDAVVLNDPFRGGTHLPDITLVVPVFLGAGSRGRERGPRFYCANRAHHADVGGAHPGSMGPVFDVHGEGLRVPPVHLVRGGVVQRDVLELLLANMRVPREREGDLLAQWAAGRLGARRLGELAAEHGTSTLTRRGRELMDWTERLARARLGAAPDTRAGAIQVADTLETERGDVTIRLALELDGDELVLDFRDTDDVCDGPVNTTRAVVVSAVSYALRLLLPAGTPTNDGLLRCARVLTRPGSLVDATYPAPVAAGNVETSQRLVDVVLAAFAELLPGRIPAASAGTMSNLTFGGVGTDREPFGHYETIAGGAGGGPDGPGAHAVQTHMTNTRNTPIEALELDVPVRVVRYTVARGSGGNGEHRGGDGIERRLRFLAPCHVSWVADRQREGPRGSAGGGAGRHGSASRLAEGSDRPTSLGGRFAGRVDAGDELWLSTPGGGGFGAPAADSMPAR